ncbi:hypothetical protein [Deinococcus sp. 12RED42]|uniref:hypothetical protein n=1 Tax=Deinococcus sp. 12RED42 TaxID=2745872 RepID=UPI001E579FC3|nr:hypothetical protein [Deinococcus sp. 12RED42]MCD0165415.1 hypothetical protein [Deinococcus sp. 12RED42]
MQDLLPRRRARASPHARQAVTGRASWGIANLTRSLRSSGRQLGTQRSAENPGAMLDRIAGAYLGYPGDTRTRLTGVLRMLLQSDEDVSGAASDYLAIVNPGHTIEFTGSRKAVKAARAELDTWATTIFPEGGGLDGLINNQILELLASPASSVEWPTDDTRSGVIGAVVVPAERIAVGYDPTTGERTYHQVGVAINPIELDPATYLYAPLLTMGGDPHGIPMFLSALRSLDRKTRLIDNVDRVIDLMRKIALVGVELPLPSPQELGLTDAMDPRYAELKAEYTNQAADMILGLADEGLFVGPEGTKFSINNITHSLTGLDAVTLENNRRVWSGLHTTGFMRGHMDSTTEALAKIVYPMIEARATNLQAVIARQLEFGLNLHLRLRGIRAVAYVRFQQAESAFKQAEAEAYKTRMEAHQIGKAIAGKAYARRFADDLDFSDDEDQHAPAWAGTWDDNADTPAPPPPAPSSGPDAQITARYAYHPRERRYVHAPTPQE